MKAKLFVKGTKEPIELEVDEAKIAEALIADPKQPRDTPFSIEGVWTGKKEDMKFVVFPVKEKEKVEDEELTQAEFSLMEKEMAICKAKAVAMKIPLYNTQILWLATKGAVKAEVRRILDYKDSPNLDLVNNCWKKIYAYERFQKAREFGQGKRDEQLDQMAEEASRAQHD